jgi:4-hydroxy-tetrahydrodipicolinate synthase
MVIPRVLSRGTSPVAQRSHFDRVLSAGADLPAVIYNSPYYGFETRADLFFSLRESHPNLVGFKEFGGKGSLTYAGEHITGGDPALSLVVGVDTQVVHGIVHCGADGVITGIGNVFPREVLRLVELSRRAAAGDPVALRWARELEDAMAVLSGFDEGPDLVLYFKYLVTLEGDDRYRYQINADDSLSPSQQAHARRQWEMFRQWWAQWEGASDD